MSLKNKSDLLDKDKNSIFKFNISGILFLLSAKYELFCLVFTKLRKTGSIQFQNKYAFIY